jgi:ribokinase
VAAARSGANVTLLGAVGDDDFGRARLADLQRDHVVTDWVQTHDSAASGVAMIFVEEGGENRIAYVPGATRTVVTGHGRAAMEATRPAILLATNELPLPVLDAMFAEARRDGSQVILNATPEPDAAEPLLGDISVLIVNAAEAAALLGNERQLEPDTAATELRAQRSIDVVVVTAGRQGAFVAHADVVVQHVPAPEVDVVDTTGAGDTFCGAFGAALASGQSMLDAVQYGVIASAISVTRAGAQPSIPTREEIERFAPSVTPPIALEGDGDVRVGR